jgi:tetratricopeptide (TPR) repeat protein
MKCIRCDSSLGLEDRFCIYCGMEVLNSGIERGKYCTNCGAEIGHGTNYCTECGAPVGGISSASNTMNVDSVESGVTQESELPSKNHSQAPNEEVPDDLAPSSKPVYEVDKQKQSTEINPFDGLDVQKNIETEILGQSDIETKVPIELPRKRKFNQSALILTAIVSIILLFYSSLDDYDKKSALKLKPGGDTLASSVQAPNSLSNENSDSAKVQRTDLLLPPIAQQNSLNDDSGIELPVILQAVIRNDEDALQKGLDALKSIPKPDVGDRVIARAENEAGLALLRKNSLSEAILRFKNGALADPSDTEIINNLGFATSLDGNEGDAIKIFEQAIRIAPERSVAWSNIGLSLARLGRMEEGVAASIIAYKLSKSQDRVREYMKRQSLNSEELAEREMYSRALKILGISQ